MKIFSIEKVGDEGFFGFANDDNEYFRFVVLSEGKIEKQVFPDIRDYVHFRDVVWKFNDYVWFTKNPIEIDELNIKNVKKCYDIFYDIFKNKE